MPLFDEVICEGCGTYVARSPPPPPAKRPRPTPGAPFDDAPEPTSVDEPSLSDDALGPAPHCEKHPAFPLVATCGRCGTELCVRCAPSLTENAEPLCRLCRPIAAPNDAPGGGPRGVGGWLLLLTLGIAAWSLFFGTIGLFALGVGATAPGLVCVATSLLGATTVVCILMHKRIAMLLILIVLGLNFLSSLMGRGSFAAAASSMFWLMVWCGYVMKSRRVRNTLVK